jgi:hypothetical protein
MASLFGIDVTILSFIVGTIVAISTIGWKILEKYSDKKKLMRSMMN